MLAVYEGEGAGVGVCGRARRKNRETPEGRDAWAVAPSASSLAPAGLGFFPVQSPCPCLNPIPSGVPPLPSSGSSARPPPVTPLPTPQSRAPAALERARCPGRGASGAAGPWPRPSQGWAWFRNLEAAALFARGRGRRPGRGGTGFVGNGGPTSATAAGTSATPPPTRPGRPVYLERGAASPRPFGRPGPPAPLRCSPPQAPGPSFSDAGFAAPPAGSVSASPPPGGESGQASYSFSSAAVATRSCTGKPPPPTRDAERLCRGARECVTECDRAGRSPARRERERGRPTAVAGLRCGAPRGTLPSPEGREGHGPQAGRGSATGAGEGRSRAGRGGTWRGARPDDRALRPCDPRKGGRRRRRRRRPAPLPERLAP